MWKDGEMTNLFNDSTLSLLIYKCEVNLPQSELHRGIGLSPNLEEYQICRTHRVIQLMNDELHYSM